LELRLRALAICGLAFLLAARGSLLERMDPDTALGLPATGYCTTEPWLDSSP